MDLDNRLRATLRSHWQWSRLRRINTSERKSINSTPHVLIISWAFPPFFGSSAHFPVAIARAAVSLGLKVSVVCSPVPNTITAPGSDLLHTLSPEIDVLRVPGHVDDHNNPTVRPIFRFLPSVDGGFDTALMMATVALQQLNETPPNIVLAAGPRFSNFVAGYYVARWAQANLALLYMDEWCVNTPPFVSTSVSDLQWEERCLHLARAVSFVTEGKKRAYEKEFPFLAAKPSTVSPNGWDPVGFSKINGTSEHLSNESNKFCISFVGRAANSAPIQPFLETLSRVLSHSKGLAESIQLVIVGKQPTDVEQQLNSFSQKHPNSLKKIPQVPHSTALEIMRESDALLLLNNVSYEGIIPQKTYDYLNVDTPILAFGNAPGSADLIQSAGAGVVIESNNVAALLNALSALMNSSPTTWVTDKRKKLAEKMNRNTIATSLLQFLLSVEEVKGAEVH